ncbi:hypothetical protein ACWNYH_00490 [Candidatus Vidania fulgoroideorum]
MKNKINEIKDKIMITTVIFKEKIRSIKNSLTCLSEILNIKLKLKSGDLISLKNNEVTEEGKYFILEPKNKYLIKKLISELSNRMKLKAKIIGNKIKLNKRSNRLSPIDQKIKIKAIIEEYNIICRKQIQHFRNWVKENISRTQKINKELCEIRAFVKQELNKLKSDI